MKLNVELFPVLKNFTRKALFPRSQQDLRFNFRLRRVLSQLSVKVDESKIEGNFCSCSSEKRGKFLSWKKVENLSHSHCAQCKHIDFSQKKAKKY